MRSGLNHVRMETIIPCQVCGKYRSVNGKPAMYRAYHWECSYGPWTCSTLEDSRLTELFKDFTLCGSISIEKNGTVDIKLIS